jgi:hypothetical protein
MHYTKPFTISRNISYFVYLFIYQLFCLSYLFVVIGYVIAIYVNSAKISSSTIILWCKNKNCSIKKIPVISILHPNVTTTSVFSSFTISRNISYFVYLFIYQLFCLSYLFVVIGYVIAIYVYNKIRNISRYCKWFCIVHTLVHITYTHVSGLHKKNSPFQGYKE